MNYQFCIYISGMLLFLLCSYYAFLLPIKSWDSIASAMANEDKKREEVCIKLRSRGKVTQANRIEGAGKRYITVIDFKEKFEKVMASSDIRHPRLSEKMRAHYGWEKQKKVA